MKKLKVAIYGQNGHQIHTKLYNGREYNDRIFKRKQRI